ncbi:MAG: hypothetical protein JOZ45_02395 [Acidobacteriaceae bacterium]|nr:hypothetical protein [Acidobacteriaceae bacterium]
MDKRQVFGGLISSAGWLLLLLASFLMLYSIVTPTEGGDTLRYAADVVEHAQGQPAQFWSFGHLLWRPWGYLGLKAIGPWFVQYFGDSEMQAVVRFFVWTNFLCSLATVVLMWDTIRRFVSLPLATGVAVAFCGANSFLNHTHLGSAYIPALCFESLCLWLLLTKVRPEGPAGFAATAMAGFSYAICVLLWFPFALTGLGMLTALCWRPLRDPAGFSKGKIQLIALFVSVLAITSAAALIVGAVAYGVHDAQDLKKWILEADNSWSQHLNIARAVTGIPRSLYELSSANILLKRWFFHDPYNPVHLSQVAGALFIKLLLFYLGITALLWVLRKWAGRTTLFILLSASVPVLFFATVVFEPGSPDRYIPLLPFLYIAAAIALKISAGRPLVFGILTATLAAPVLFNAVALSSNSSKEVREVREEVRALEGAMPRPGSVFVTTFRDPLYYAPLTRPLDHALVSRKYTVTDVIEIASTRLLHWHAEFADRALQSWEGGRDVWVSQKLLTSRPAANGAWVEGDDPRIRWSALPEFFRQFATDRSEGGPDGFVRLADTPENRAALQRCIRDDPGYKGSTFYARAG